MENTATENSITIPGEELDKLLAGCDGNAALLYLYVRRVGKLSLQQAARSLKCTEAELGAAAAALRNLGLLDDRQMSLERSEAPEYTAEDVTARARTDPAFEAAAREAESVMGRVLSSGDLKLLFGIYDYWGLPADVIMVLLHHCAERCVLRYGPGRKPTMRSVEKEAQFWAKNEIVTLDAAEDFLRRDREKQAMTGQVREILQIHGREFTAGERGYVENWLALGFGPEAIAIAYDRTVLSTGRLTWKYMDKILRSWDEKGLYSPEAIESGDARRAGAPAAPRPRTTEPEQGGEDKLDAMRRMLAHMKRQEK